MSEWAVTAASRFVSQESHESQKWMLAQLRYQSLLAQAPKLWEAVQEALASRIRTFNECVGREVLFVGVTTGQRLTAHAKTASGRRSLCADFDTGRCAIACSAYSMEGIVDFNERYGMAINGDNVAIVTGATGGEFSADVLAERMLNGLMGWK
jgi:hypothetical protein